MLTYTLRLTTRERGGSISRSSFAPDEGNKCEPNNGEQKETDGDTTDSYHNNSLLRENTTGAYTLPNSASKNLGDTTDDYQDNLTDNKTHD